MTADTQGAYMYAVLCLCLQEWHQGSIQQTFVTALLAMDSPARSSPVAYVLAGVEAMCNCRQEVAKALVLQLQRLLRQRVPTLH